MKNGRAVWMMGMAGVVLMTALFVGCSKKEAAQTEQPAAQSGTGETVLASTGKTIKWSLFSPYGPQDSACCFVWPELFKEVYRRTGGQLEITVFWSGQHPYEGSDMLKVIQDGAAEMAHFYSGYLTSAEPVFGIDGIPMMLPADSMQAFAIMSKLWGNFEQDTSGVLERILEEKWGASMVHLMPATFQRMFTKGYGAPSVDSLKGHKVRVYSSELATLVKIMGGTPVSLNSGEVYTALSTGLVDGLVTGIQFAEANGYLDVCDTINLWEIMSASDGLIVSMKALNALPADVREVFLDVMRTSAKKPELRELQDCSMILEALIKDGRKVVVPSVEARTAVTNRVKAEIIDPWVKAVGNDAFQALQQVE